MSKNKFQLDSELQSLLLSQMIEGFVVQDVSGTIIKFNQSALKILDLSEDQLLGKTSFDPTWKAIKLNGEPLEGKDHPAMIAINQGIKVYDSVMGVSLPNNQIRWININSTPIFKDGKVAFSFTTFSDITERIKLSIRLDLALESSQIGIWDFDIINNHLVWDSRMFNVYGVDPKNFTNAYEAWEKCLLPEDRIKANQIVGESIKTGTGFETKFKVQAQTGEIKTLAAKAKVFCNQDSVPIRIIGANWDISASEKINEELILAKNKAIEASLAKSTFLANTGHEIRTPMNGIIGSIDLLLDTHLSNEQKELCETIKICGENLLKLINNVLDLSKIESGKIEIEKKLFDLKTTVVSVVKILTPIALAKNLQLDLEFINLNHEFFLGDAQKINQVLINLINNAIKFTKTGQVKITITEKQLPNKISHIEFSISDTGVGIDEKNFNKIFNSFEQADASITREFGGTGLGLAISKRFIELMGGEIYFKSRLNVGTTFIFNLTLPISEQINLQSNSTISTIKDYDFSNLKVLLVEDNEINSKIAGKLLAKLQANFEIATDGNQAIEKCQNNTFDLILMDLQMPGISGYEATLAILKLDLKYKPKIVALSANMLSEEKEKCLAIGMIDFYQKPITREYLIQILTNHSS